MCNGNIYSEAGRAMALAECPLSIYIVRAPLVWANVLGRRIPDPTYPIPKDGVAPQPSPHPDDS